MNAEKADDLAEKYNGEVYDAYSGRGMFGTSTFGVVIDIDNYQTFVRSSDKGKYRSDNLGKDFIIY